MKKYGFVWSEKKTIEKNDDRCWIKKWYTDITFSMFSKREWGLSLEKFDGMSYFLLIFWFFMFRFGKFGHCD
jgi:hypothetical protein